jgi:enamine deaminase RidA (YjgF/YER057c/UK114 family)
MPTHGKKSNQHGKYARGRQYLPADGGKMHDASGKGPGRQNDFEKQTEQVYLNIKSCVESAVGAIRDVANNSIYMVNISKKYRMTGTYVNL